MPFRPPSGSSDASQETEIWWREERWTAAGRPFELCLDTRPAPSDERELLAGIMPADSPTVCSARTAKKRKIDWLLSASSEMGRQDKSA